MQSSLLVLWHGEGIIFSPEQDYEGYYNLWKGFAVIPKKGDWSLMKEHIVEVISDGYQERANWIFAYIARMYQDPGGDRPGTCIVLRGSQATGKGVFVHEIGCVLGKHYINVSNPDHLVAKFNLHLKDKLLVFADEGSLVSKRAMGVLKSMITEPYLTVEGKNINAFRIKNNMNLIIASNDDQIIPAQMDERRFFVMDVSEKRKNDHQYFTQLKDQMSNGGREAMLYDLLKTDTSNVNLRAFPRTNALLDQIYNGFEPAELYWYECLKAGSNLIMGDTWIPGIPFAKQYDDFLNFVDKQKIKPTTPSVFGKRLKKLCPGISRQRPLMESKRVWVNNFPQLEVCRKDFEKIVGISIAWDDGSGAREAA